MDPSDSRNSAPKPSGETTQEQDEALSQARLRLAVELWETEQNYIRGLQALLTAYKAPLLHAIAKGHPLIPEEAIEAVFMNVEEIIAIHERIFISMQTRINEWNSQSCIADIFLQIAADLLVYRAYVLDYDHANETLDHWCRTSAKFDAFLKETALREHTYGASREIRSLLVMPVSRVPRYALILREFLRLTHASQETLLQAQHELQNGLDDFNHQMQITRGQTHRRTIRSEFKPKFAFPTLLSPRILFDGELKAVKRGKMRFVVFENYLLIGEHKTDVLGRSKSKLETVVWCPLEWLELAPASETSWHSTIVPSGPTAPSEITTASSSAPQPGSRSTSSSSSSPTSPRGSNTDAPTVVTTLQSFTITWDDAEAMSLWLNMIADAQAALKRG